MPQCAIGNVKIHIEVPLLLVFFAFTFSDSIGTNLIIYRTCYASLGYNKSECALLGSRNSDNSTAQLEKIVEPSAAVVSVTRSLTEATFSGLICLFVGPWSDRFGRKPILILTLLGFVLAYSGWAIFALFEYISPWYSLLSVIPVVLTGGGSSYITASLCYITDVTNERNRGMRMGVFEAVLASGIFLGNVSSSYMLQATNYPTVFLIAAGCCFLGIIYTVFFIPESLTNLETEGRFRGLFQLTNIKDMVVTTFKRRTNYDRFVLFCCILSLTLYLLVINGQSAVIFLFLREKFHWSLQQYTLYNASHNVTWILGTLIGIYIFHKFMKISETVMLLIGFASMLTGMLIMGFAKYSWEVYTAAYSRSLGGVLSPMVRSLVSKMVPNEEVGKIFALIVVSQFLFGTGGSPLYTAIYNSTISTNPAIFNFVSAGFYIFQILITGMIIVALKSTNQVTYNEIVNEDGRERHVVDEIPA